MSGRAEMLTIATHRLDDVQGRLGTMSPSTPVRDFESVGEKFNEIERLVAKANTMFSYECSEKFEELEKSCQGAYEHFEALRSKSPAYQLSKLQSLMGKLEIAVLKLKDFTPESLNQRVSDCSRRLEKVGKLMTSLKETGLNPKELRKYQNTLNHFEDTIASYQSTDRGMYSVSSFADDLY